MTIKDKELERPMTKEDKEAEMFWIETFGTHQNDETGEWDI